MDEAWENLYNAINKLLDQIEDQGHIYYKDKAYLDVLDAFDQVYQKKFSGS